MNPKDLPETYVDQLSGRLNDLKSDVEDVVQAQGQEDVVTTGTTIIGLIGRDRKIGIIASDGRVSLGPYSFEEQFKKVFNFRTGFVGVAGQLGLIQVIMPRYKADIATISDKRGEPMTAAGASRRLFTFYRAALGQAGGQASAAFAALFWDTEDESCHLYKLAGGSFLPHQTSVAVGSGAQPIGLEVDELNPEEFSSTQDLIDEAARLIKRTTEKDNATNRNMFYGIIDNGNFETGKMEVR